MLENLNFEKEAINARLQRLNGERQRVEKIVDKLGLGVDPGIKETVAIFRAMDFPTESSCAGHTNEPEDEGYGLPYIRIYAPSPEGWNKDKNNKELEEKWKKGNQKFREKLIPLLEEFNKDRTSAKDAILHMSNIGIFGAFTVESIGTENTKKIKDRGELIVKIKQYQEEMKLFTEFLKNKFLKNI